MKNTKKQEILDKRQETKDFRMAISMRIKIIFAFVLLISTVFISKAQEKNRCAINTHISASDKIKKQQFEIQVQEFLKSNKNARINESKIIKIPVVVHVIHNQADGKIAGNNIPDEQIFSQIRVLNEDYRKKVGTMGWNNNPVGADMQIEFVLASIDPEGKPSSGITRTYNSRKNFDILDDRYYLSSLAYWDSNKFLNIWVSAFDAEFIGYGEFPGGAIDGLENEDSDEAIDGVFIEYTAFGSQSGTNTKGLYKFGRTATHEIGHWFGLIHTWGDEFCGTDYCEDTPPTETSNNASTCKTVYSYCSGIKTKNMIENFMDYSPDTCMNIFTNDQKNRVNAVLSLSKRRARLIKNAEFQLPTTEHLTVNIFPNPTTNENLILQVLLPDFQDIEVEIYDLQGKKVYSKTFIDYPSTLLKISDTFLPIGMYILKVKSKEEEVIKRFVII